MSKNLTRKGLALGAAAALASTVFAGAPALAAGEINVVPAAGTSYAIASGSQFTLATTFAPGYAPAAYAQLKYLVKTDANSTVKFAASNANNAALTTAVGNATAQAVSTTSAAVGGAVTLATEVSYLALNAQTTSVTSAVEVTAFADANNDGALTAGEWNTVKTVTFKKAADIVPVVTLTAPATADTSVKATVAWGDLNIEQMANESVKFTVGTQIASATAGTLANGVWSSTVTALAAAEAVTAQAYDGTTALGTAASATAAARTIAQPVSGPVTSDNAVAATAAATTAATVRTNSAFSVAATVKTTAAVAKAGQVVSVTVTPSGSLSTTRTLSVNGTVYNGTVAIPTLSLTTDAAGQVKVDLVTVGFAAAETVAVAFSAENYTTTTTATMADATYTIASTEASSTLRSIAEGGSATLNFAVKDQFGKAIGSGARIKFVVGYTTSATSYVPVVDGKASITVTDTTASVATAISVTSELEIQNAATSNWAPLASTVTGATQTVNVAAAAVAFDTDPAAASATPALSTATNITGSVNNAGAAVTLAGTDVIFTVNSVDYTGSVTVFTTANGDFTVAAKSNKAGAKTVTVTAGAVSKTVALTVGAAASNSGLTLTVTAPATVVPGQTFTVTGKLVDQYGNPVAVTNALTATPASTDRGFSVTYTGPGFVIGGALPTATNAAGEFSFQVLTGAADSGSATVTVTYDLDGSYASITSTTPATSAAAISKTATVSIAAPAAPEVKTTIVGVTKAIRVRVENAKGEEVEIVVNGRTVAVATAGTNSKLWVLKSTKGKKSVKVYVDGDLVAVKTVTVK